ncbi:MAG TPA: DDE-type integrase/transposase/recombinase [Phycisphaerae bacterium]|nr:DDE-type integrase/transposase/recombinase [Phycisphaerae bacterium]
MANNLATATEAVAVTVKAEPHAVASPADGFVALGDVLGAFGTPELKATRRTAQRWAADLPSYLRNKRAGQWYVHVDARLPDGGQVLAFLKCGGPPKLYAGQALPPGSDQWTQKGWDHLDNVLELRRRYDEMRPRFPRLSKEAFARVFAQEHGGWAASCGPYRLSCKRKALDTYFARIDPHNPQYDGGIDRRGRKTADGQVAGCSREAWDFFKTLYLTQQQRKIALCWEIVTVEAQKNGWSWPALRTIEKRLKAELPPFIADYHRLGPQRWARKHAPRIERDLSGTRPNQAWVGDHALFDFLCLVDGKPVRPWITAWMDQRSRRLVGWTITAGPDSDTILAAFREAVIEYGAPLQVIIDNGKDYRSKAVSGGRRGKPRIDEERVKSVLGRLDIRVTFCEPFNPGSKAIERLFGTMHDRFDRLFDSYCGSEPKERPEDLYRRLKVGRVNVPTLDEVRARFAGWAQAYHDRPHSGNSMEGRSPRWVFEHCDPIPKRTAPRDTLDKLLEKAIEVKVTKRGVRYRKVYYGQGNVKLHRLHGQSVLLRVNPERGDLMEVCDVGGRHITWAAEQRLDGTKQEHVKEGYKRQRAAAREARSARSAIRDANKSVVAHAIAAQREHAGQLRKAAGGESDVPPPPRDLAIMPGAIELVRAGVAPPPPAALTEHPAHGMDDLVLSEQDGRERETLDCDYGQDVHLSDHGPAEVEQDESLGELSLSEGAGDEDAQPGGADGLHGSGPSAVGDLIMGLNDG